MFTNATFKLLQVYLNSVQSLNMACETKKKQTSQLTFSVLATFKNGLVMGEGWH